jgi:6-phosphofructokinase 1
VVVAEGAQPIPGTMKLPEYEHDQIGRPRYGGICASIAQEIETRTGYESRVVQIGHVQRGGTPTAYDRILSTRFGLAAVDALHNGAAGHMVALRSSQVTTVPLSEVVNKERPIDMNLFHEIGSVFFG